MAAFPQRMWVGGRVARSAPLAIGEPAERSSRLRAAELKEGSTGRFWLVTVRALDHARAAKCASRRSRTSCCASRRRPWRRDADVDDPPAADWVEARTADPVLLFRYSALTFNAHRIHYDEPYATGVEGYPDLVVQGPLTATLLCELARVRTGQSVRSLTFRARVPLFANRRFWLVGHATDTGADLAAVRGDGQTAMTLTATLR